MDYASGYQPGSGPAQGTLTSSADSLGEEADHEQLKKDYLAYLGNKSEEIKEQKDARRYYHSSQWSQTAVKEFKRRKQPVVTYNREAKKINAIIGLLERQRQDPRAYPRTPKQEDGAEIATATIRYVVDEQRWKEKSPLAALNGAVDGIGGVEIIIEQGDQGDPEVGLEVVDPSSFFYDPRSLKADFDDGRFKGVSKWSDLNAACEMFPAHEAAIRAAVESGQELTTNPDSDDKWISGNVGSRKVRIVDHWYIRNGEWYWCIYTGDVKLDEGISYLKDEKGKTFCKYIMFSANVDQDGDRYGFHRGMKSAQDEINQRRSKGLHLLNSRRMIIEKGSVDDVEKTRQEAVRPDGVIVVNPGTTPPLFDDAVKNAELQGQLGFLEDAKNEIDNYGFNPSLMGSGVQDMSGKAIQLQQAAGIAELGPYLLAYKGWKLRVYRAIWDAIQQHWTAERWIRVTDDQNLAQFFQINGQGIDPQTGLPALVNSLGALDVDIIVDEGPDAITMQADTYETLKIMAQSGAQIPPQLLIEMSPLPGSEKKKYLEMLDQMQQGPQAQAQQAAIRTKLTSEQAAADAKEAQAGLFRAQTEEILGTIPSQIGKTQAETVHTAALAHEADAKAGATHALTLERFTNAHVNAKTVMEPPTPVVAPATPTQP